MVNTTTESPAKAPADSLTLKLPAKRPSRLRRFFPVLGIFLLLLAAGWLLRAPLLTGVAKAWIVSEPLDKADAIVVLGGGVETRPFEAAKLYHAGLAPKILIMNQKVSQATTLGITQSEAELTRRLLRNENVPGSDLVVVGHDITNTHDESLAVYDWAKANNAKTLIVTTDLFHTRRARWTFRKQLNPLGVRVLVDAAPAREYSASDWWKTESGVVAFQNEVLKFAYYLVKY